MPKNKNKPVKPTQAQVLKLGPEIAALKVNMPKKRWRAFVAQAKKRGFTVEGALSGAPDALKERTNAGLRRQAEQAVNSAYKAPLADLSRRESAAGFLAQKRAADDAAYRTWMMGEVDKLDAAARAADTTLATQQSDIASDLNAAQAAAKTDSAARVAALAGNVSNPSQSTALDQTAADTRSREQVAAAREHTASLQKIGADANQVSRAALIATAAVRAATSQADTWKTQSEIQSDRAETKGARAAAIAGMIQDLKAGEVSKAQTREELGLAAGELGVKRASIMQEAKEAARKYGLDKAKFNLDRWKARNADAVARARVELGYDELAERKGQKAADRALDEWIEKYRAKQNDKDRAADAKGDKKGITPEERKTYQGVETVRHLIVRKRNNGKTDAQIRNDLVEAGFDNVTIDVANDLARNNGALSPNGVKKAKRLGIKHVGYFWDKENATSYPNNGPSGNRPHDSQQP